MTTRIGSRRMQVVMIVFAVFGLGVSIYMIYEVVQKGASFETLFPAGAWVIMTVAWVVNYFYLGRPMPEGVVPESAEADRPSLT